HFEPLLGAVFTDPVAVEYPQVGVLSGDALLADALDVLAPTDAVDALALGSAAAGEAFLASGTLPDRDASDDDALLGLVAEFACLIEARRTLDPLDRALLAPFLFSLPLEL